MSYKLRHGGILYTLKSDFVAFILELCNNNVIMGGGVLYELAVNINPV